MFSKKKPEPVPTPKVVVIGSATQTGKTALILRYLYGTFNLSEHIPSPSGAFHAKLVSLGTRKLGLKVWDTPGDERFRSLLPSLLGMADAVIICFSLDDQYSFEDLENLLKIPRRECPPGSYILLVGTKCDLKEDGYHQQRVVAYDEAEAFARSHGLPYIEVSAKENINVNEAFQMLNEEMVKKFYGEESSQKQPESSCSMF